MKLAFFHLAGDLVSKICISIKRYIILRQISSNLDLLTYTNRKDLSLLLH